MVDIEGEIFNSKTDHDDFYVNLWYSWSQKNPEMFYVLEKQNHIIGFISMLPLPREKIERILFEQDSPSSVTIEDIQIYKTGGVYDSAGGDGRLAAE